MAFTHLHLHTEYSLLDGSGKINEIIGRAAELGMDSLAITDHGAMYGVIDFYKASKAAGIHPVIGCEIYVTSGSRFDRENTKEGERYYHLVLLAENNTGYENLMKIVSRGFTEGFYYKPRVDYEILNRYHEGIIALSACLAGEVQRYLVRGMYEEAEKKALEYRSIFGNDNYFLELQDHGLPDQKLVNQALIRISRETGIKLVATNDVHYTYAEDVEAHDILLCIQTAKKVTDTDRMRYEGGQYYLKSEEEMKAIFPYAHEAVERTHEIAMRCNVDIEFGVTKLPEYDVPGGGNAYDYLEKLCNEGLEKRYKDVTGDLTKRLEYELSVIKKMGYVDYFLIVWDYINFAKQNGIAVGPGRGSAAGSIVAYSMGITDIDPIRYSLIFERFLNPERVSMPDIDVDFCFERRQEVIDYVVKKYGKERVVQIITFGTMAARGVVRDVGRALDLPYAKCDAIAKMIPNDLGMTLDKALKKSPELKSSYDSDEEVKKLLDMSRRLEGLPRHSSMHAAGVVISKKNVDEYVPLSRAADGSITTQYTMGTLEELGLLKMDFLGLRTLTVIQNAVKQIEGLTGKKLDMLKIDFGDTKVMESIGTGKTDGVFQLESSGMQSFMKELKPSTLEDIIAGISLYRPGPMDFIPRYLKGKNDPASITYENEKLRPILSPTYGCIVYQEQVMQIVRDLAGYSLGRSDLVRRAMSKKKAAVMEKERKNFIFGSTEENVKGCLANGIDEKTASHIFDEMTDFAKYAFNKSHAACYAVVAFQTAYLKYYYPEEFMAALMTSVIDNTSKVSEYILTCRQMKIAILPPDINEGESGFFVVSGGIRYGLSAIKNVGAALSEEIISERTKHGKYRSIEDFAERLGNDLNRRALENFIKAGATDTLEGNRKQKILVIPELIRNNNGKARNGVNGQMSLFDIASEEDRKIFSVTLPDVKEYLKDDILRFEKETLGIYLSGHPLQAVEEIWNRRITARSSDFIVEEEQGSARVKDGAHVIIGGIISDITKKITKTGKMMAFITIEDLIGSVEVLVFPNDYEKYMDMIEEDKKIFVEGRVSIGDDPAGKLISERMYPIPETAEEEKASGMLNGHRAAGYPNNSYTGQNHKTANAERDKRQESNELWIRYNNREEYESDLAGLMVILGKREGHDKVNIFLKTERQIRYMGDNWRVKIDDSLVETLEKAIGKGNVKIVSKQS